MRRAFREGGHGWKLPSTTQSLLPQSIGGDNPLTLIGTLTDLELRLIACYRKEEGWNHEHKRRPFYRDGFFYCLEGLGFFVGSYSGYVRFFEFYVRIFEVYVRFSNIYERIPKLFVRIQKIRLTSP